MNKKNKTINITSIEDIILFLETIAFLHDIGKISSSFVISKASDGFREDIHALLPLKDQHPSSLSNKLNIQNLHNNQYFNGEILPFSLICAHHGCDRCLEPCKDKEKNNLVSILRLADQKTSEEEKGLLIDTYRQPMNATYLSTLFGREKKLSLQKLDKDREILWQFLNKAFQTQKISFLRKKVLRFSKPFYTRSPSETRRPGNDICLWDHSVSVATYFKIALYEIFKSGKNMSSLSVIPFIFLKVREEGEAFRKLIEEEETSGNLVLEIYPYEIYVISKSFAEEKDKWLKNLKNDEYYLSYNIQDLLPYFPNLLKEISNKHPKFLVFDINYMLKNIPSLMVTHPLDKKNHLEACLLFENILSFNLYREQKEIEEKVKSLNKHLTNLRKGRLEGDRLKEYREKMKIFLSLKKDLHILNKHHFKPEIPSEEISKKRQINYDLPLLSIYKRWFQTSQAISFKDYALYSLFRRESSLTLAITLCREVNTLLNKIVRFLSTKYNKKSKTLFPFLFPVSTLEKKEIEEIRNMVITWSGKFYGFTPCYIHNNKIDLPNFDNTFSFYHLKEKRILKKHLLMSFDEGTKIKLPLLLGNDEIDIFRLYREDEKRKLIHLMDAEKGSCINFGIIS